MSATEHSPRGTVMPQSWHERQQRLPMPRLKVVVAILDYMRRYDGGGHYLVQGTVLASAVGIGEREAQETLPWMAMHGLVEEVMGDSLGYRLRLGGLAQSQQPPQPAPQPAAASSLSL